MKIHIRLSGRLELITAFILSQALVLQTRADYFTNITSMNLNRVGHTGTLLSNGRVLVAGGRNDTGVINNESELYNPTNGTWGITGFMNTQRVGHASVLLNNGKVLTCGGLSVFYSGYLSSAELYDPSAGTWSATGPISFARYSHTAALLKSGYVLIAGGDATNGVTSSTELYNPNTGTWASTGSLNVQRDSHTQTLLPDGRVLVVGGYSGSGPFLYSAELYNPTSGITQPPCCATDKCSWPAALAISILLIYPV
jgi:hypothetical protein